VDQGSIGAPSFWIETDVDANGMRYESGAVLEQTKNIFSPNSAADPYAGTFLQYIGAGSETLTNYDIYVAINAAVAPVFDTLMCW
jgi:predicted metalloprotease